MAIKQLDSRELEAWLDNPVTSLLIKGSEVKLRELMDAMANGSFYMPYAPYETAERTANAFGQITACSEYCMKEGLEGLIKLALESEAQDGE